MKLTKDCTQPWDFYQIHAGGMVQCCAVGNDTDLGDFIIDYCQKKERGVENVDDIFNHPGLVALRQGLLTGNLRPMCRRCFFRPDKLISTDELTAKLKAHFKRHLPAGTNLDKIDLARTYAFNDAGVSFTNRCNLSCIYCVQSTQAKSNPYFKMEFPFEYARDTLALFAAQGIIRLRSCVEGEATIYRHWYELFSEFKDKYPHIDMYMTTNLSRRYSDQEIGLLARYKYLDVSCDTLDPELYGKLRRGGNLELVLENIKLVQAKAREMGTKPVIMLHALISDLTWPTLDALADYALVNDILPNLGNYEERPNAVSYQNQICRPLTAMSMEDQTKARDCILRVRAKTAAYLDKHNCGPLIGGVDVLIQGGLLYNVDQNVEHNYNRFDPYDDNPLHRAFHRAYPHGEADMHLDIVYDYDNFAYNGVRFSRPGRTLRLNGFAARQVVLREVSLYKPGCASTKYEQTVLPGFRKSLTIENNIFEYTPKFGNDIAEILLEISDWQA